MNLLPAVCSLVPLIVGWSQLFAEPVPYRVKDLKSTYETTTQLINPTAVGSSLFFAKYIENSDYFLGDKLGLLYRTNGSSTGTTAFGDGFSNSTIYIPWDSRRKFATSGNHLFFAGLIGNGGTRLLKIGEKDEAATIIYGVWDPYDLTTVGSQVFFSAYDSYFTNGLWKTDGTPGGTVQIIGADMLPGTWPQSLREMNGKLYFYATDRSNGISLFQSDGTNAGTISVKTPTLDPYAYFFSFNGSLYFANRSGLFKSENPSSPPKLIQSGIVLMSRTYAGSILLITFNSSHQLTLWRSDGTSNGTAKVMDFPDYDDDIRLRFISELGGSLYFSLAKQGEPLELWKTDGTALGTERFIEIPRCYDVRAAVVYHDRLYLDLLGEDINDELWSSDGTAMGTRFVAPIATNFQSDLDGLRATDSLLYYVTSDWEAGNQLFAFDDTPAAAPELAASLTGVTRFSADFNLDIDPNRSPTTVKIHYGLTASHGAGQEIPFTPTNGTLPETVSTSVAGLLPGTTYHYQFIAENSWGKVSTEDRTFTTTTNQSPSLTPITLLAYDHSPITFVTTEFIRHASDPEADPLSMSFGAAESGASIIAVGDQFVYTPPSGFVGTDHIPFSVTDPYGAIATSEISVHVAGNFGHPWLTGSPSVFKWDESSSSESFAYFSSSANPAQTYILQRSTDLSHWEDIGTPVGGSNGYVFFLDENPPSAHAFYRLRSP